MHRQLKNHHFFLMIAVNAVLFILAHALAYLCRFEFALTQVEIWQFTIVLPWLILLKSCVFLAFGLYHGMWRYTGFRELWRLAQACFISMLLIMSVVLFVNRFEGFSRSVYLLDAGFTFFWLVASGWLFVPILRLRNACMLAWDLLFSQVIVRGWL